MTFIKVFNKELSIDDIKENLKINNSDIVYIAGSVIEGQININSKGMGNKYSDIDVFVIRNDESKNYNQSENFVETQFETIKNLNVDIEFYSYSDILRLMSSINQLNLNDNKRIEEILDTKLDLYKVNAFISRLNNSICLQNIREYTELIEMVNVTKFKELYITHLINIIENNIADVKGNLESGQYDVALYSLRLVFIQYLKIFIMNNNEFIDREKWVFLKYQNLQKDNKDYLLNNNYEKLFYSEMKNEKVKKNIIEEILEYIDDSVENLYMKELAI